MATNIGTLMATIGVDTKPLKKGLKDAERQTQASTKKMLGHWKSMAAGIAVSIGAYKIAGLIKESVLLAARFETLGVVMETVGRNAGYSAEQMERYDLALRETGISMVESRRSLARMAMAQFDLNKATELGRIAQDAAVIGNINSSEAFERMIYGIQSGHLLVLKTIGLNVSFEDSYQKVADAVDRTTASFSPAEKVLIRQNAVLEYGSRIAGTYEAAMTTAGKKLTSFIRYVNDFKVKMGLAFGPATVILVDAATAAMKEMQDEISKPEAQAALKNLSTQLAKTITQLGRDLPKAIEKTTDAIASLQALYNVLPDGVIGAAGVGLVGRILFGSTTGGALAAGLYLINTQVKQIDTGIWEGAEVKWGLDTIVKDYQDFANSIYKISDEMAGRTIEGLPVEPLVKRFKVTAPSGSLPEKPDSVIDDDWMEQFRKKEELSKEQIKSMQAQEAFAISMSEAEQERINGRYELSKEINRKIHDDMLSDTEFKLQQLDAEFLAYDSLVKDKAALDQWYMSEYAKITEADEEYQKRLELEEEFNQEYAEMGKSRFDLERMEVENMAQIYEKAGFDKVKIAELTSDKMKAISKAESAQRLSDIHSTVSTMTQGFQQVSEMGGKHSKKAFAAYKAFKIVETLISTYSGAMKAYESMLSIPIVGKALGIAAAAAVVGFGMAQVASISAMQAPSYDRGGVSRAGGLYRTGNIDEAHIPLESGGTIPVRFDGQSEEPKEQTPINIINVNDPSQLDMYLASSRGQDAILNVLGSRNQTAKRLLR